MNNEINWIIGCETSGVTREAFRKFGINCWSVDILPSDNNSKFHIQDDILKVLWKLRSRTFQGIGDAFAKQWHNL